MIGFIIGVFVGMFIGIIVSKIVFRVLKLVILNNGTHLAASLFAYWQLQLVVSFGLSLGFALLLELKKK